MAQASGGVESDGFTPPFGPSWVDRLFDWIEGLPIPVWSFHAGFFAIAFGVGFVFNAPNYPEIPGWMLTSISPMILAGNHWLRFVTVRSVERIRPALDLDDSEARLLGYRLTIAPPRTAWALLAFEVVYLPLYVASSAEPFGYRELSWGILIPGLIVWAFGEGMGYVFILMAIRRLVIIGRIHRSLDRVELFRQQPLHAFSAVTIRTALFMLVLFGYVPLLTLGSEAFTDPIYLGSLVVGAIMALVIAVVPLTGTHRVLAETREQRSMANGHRIQETLEALETAVDAGDAAGIEQRQKALSALLTERDLLAKVPTWPWAPGTIRTMATTILVPIFLLIASRIADRWFG